MIIFFDKRATPEELAIGQLLDAEEYEDVYVRVHTLDGKQGEMSIALLAGYIREILIDTQERLKQEKRNAHSAAEAV